MDLASLFVVASQQHGAVHHRQLRALGVSAKAQRSAIADGWMVRAAPSVVVLAAAPDTWHRRLRVGLLALGPKAWVSHEAAAALHGLDRTSPGDVEFTVPRGCRRVAITGAAVHTTRDVGPTDVISVHGFRCASATRTVLDLAAAGVDAHRLGAAIDSAVRLHLSAPVVLAERLAEVRRRGRGGVRLLDRLLLDTGGETILERRFLALVRNADLPRPETQRRIRSEGRHVARVDFCWNDVHVVVEVTGRLGHSNPADRTRDAQRRNELQDLGYRVYEYTWSDLTSRPQYVIGTLRQRLDC
jgi:very-short-patch-repair endonuclease